MNGTRLFVRWGFLAILLISIQPQFVFAAGPKGTVYKISVPHQGNLNGSPTYFCWLPDSVTTYRCIIVHQHGCTREGDASKMVSDVQWITLAKKWHAPFIACSLATGSNCGNWNDPNNGSGNTYLAALDSLARRTAHPEISTIPWALWGHSGGSMWIMRMTGKYPQRVAVAIAQACGADISNVPAALKVPILHHNGRKDICYNDGYFSTARAKGALWAHAINPLPMWVNGPSPASTGWDTTVYGHAPHDLRMLCIPWIDIGLTMRLPDQAGSSQLKDMDTTNAWLGDKATRTIASAATYTGNKLAACWFPNQTLAKKWAQYMATKTANDSTPPPAPYNLTGTYANRQIVLKWDADADLETGIKTFTIYRNGTLLQTLQWPNAPATLFSAAKGYQRWDDGDQPNPVSAPAMTFTDNNLSDTATYVYQVATVNWQDGTGPKSAPIALKAGQVTEVKTPPAVRDAIPHRSTTLCESYSNGTVNLLPGKVEIYDIRGRLLKSMEVHGKSEITIKSILGKTAEKVMIIQNSVK
jgi:pimeloyl-ACP methyl ester carboxylesterase